MICLTSSELACSWKKQKILAPFLLGSPSPSPTSSPTSKCYMGECTVTPFPLFISPLIDPLLALMSGGASSSTSSPSYSSSSTSSTPSLHIITGGYSVKMWFFLNASWTLLSHMVLKSFYLYSIEIHPLLSHFQVSPPPCFGASGSGSSCSVMTDIGAISSVIPTIAANKPSSPTAERERHMKSASARSTNLPIQHWKSCQHQTKSKQWHCQHSMRTKPAQCNGPPELKFPVSYISWKILNSFALNYCFN